LATVNAPDGLLYTTDHEWLSVVSPGLVRLGVTDYGQDALGEIVFIEMASIGRTVERGELLGEIESTKSVTEIYAPLSGTVARTNDELAAAPTLVNRDPYGDGWLLELNGEPPIEHGLLDAASYVSMVEG
jgi:glycine cleavage system H protein